MVKSFDSYLDEQVKDVKFKAEYEAARNDKDMSDYTNCFAWSCGDKCNALKDGRCFYRVGGAWEDCPFYKSVATNRAQLIKYNHTDDIRVICKRYADDHSGICAAPNHSNTIPHDMDAKITDLWNRFFTTTMISIEIGWPKDDVTARVRWLKAHGLVSAKKNMEGYEK